MADCSYARCMQERRTIKKHLQKWTKNCIYTLGFERVAEEFMGRRKWRLYQEKVLKSWCPSIEKEIEIKDWDPNDDKCSFCDLELPGKVTDDEPGSPLRSDFFNLSGHNNNNNNNNNIINSNNNNHIDLLENDDSDSNSSSSAGDSMLTMNALDSVSSMAAIAALTGPGGTPNPLLYPPGVFSRWYLPQPPRALLEGMTKTDSPMVMNLSATSGSEMPLDLSAKSSKPQQTTESLENNIRVPNLIDSKPIMKGRPRMSPMSGRRTYTEDELQAALRDIQSGKLGTRRAAVIYGIPRSTLRNKVYKLALEKERDAHLLLAPIPRPSPPDGAVSSPTLSVNPEREDSSAEDEKDSEATKPQLSMEDLMRISALDSGPQLEGLTALLQSISRLHAEGINSNDLTVSGNSLLASYLDHLLKLKENLSPESEKDKVNKKDNVEKKKDDNEEVSKETDETGSQDSNDKAKFSPLVLPQLMRQIVAEERLLIEEQLKRKMGSENGVEDDQSNVILRIPSFKPNASCSKPNNGDSEQRYSTSPAAASQENSRHSVISPSLNGDSESPPAGKSVGISSLRDVIAKSISQKFQQDGISQLGLSPSVLGPEAMDALAKRGSFSHLNLPHPHSILKNHFDRSQQRPTHSSSAQTNTQGKGTRPKRGKYRNYNRDSLVEAVRAVQRGEMSVHRAGSYYGVPHSTLEYKVKERHLMRPRKREPKGEDKNKLTSSGSTSGITTSCPDKVKPLVLAPKPPNSKPSFSNSASLSNGLKIPPNIFETSVSPLAAYAGSPFPFWPPTPFHPLPLDISRGAFPTTPEQLFAPQLLRSSTGGGGSGADAPPSPSGLPPSTRRIAESLYDGSGNSGSFLDGIIRSSLEMGLNASQKIEKDPEKSGKNTENMSNKALLDQLCRNSRLTPVPRPSGESTSDDDGASRNIPFDLSRSSDDDTEDKKTKKIYDRCSDRESLEREIKKKKICEKDATNECSRIHEDRNLEGRNTQEGRSYRLSISDDRSKHSSDVELNGDQDDLSGEELHDDEDIDNISNHASDEEDVKDS